MKKLSFMVFAFILLFVSAEAMALTAYYNNFDDSPVILSGVTATLSGSISIESVQGY